MKEYPSQARLRELFDYDPDGFLVWRHRKDIRPCIASRTSGSRAGHVFVDADDTSHYVVSINNIGYEGGRLIWIYHHGDIPSGMIVRRIDAIEWFRIGNLKLDNDTKQDRRVRWWKSKNKYIGVYKKNSSFGWNCCNQDGTETTYTTEEAAATAYDNDSQDNGKGRPNETKPEDVSKKVINKSLSRYISTALRIKNSGGMIGVYRHKNGVDFICRFAKTNIKGRFETKEQAARAYNIAAYEHYGENAVLNDIPDPLGKGDAF